MRPTAAPVRELRTSDLIGEPVPMGRGATIAFIAMCISAAALMVLGGWWVLSEQARGEVRTSALIGCEVPSEMETRLVYINARPDGSIAVECGPLVGGRGAYPGTRK